MIILSKDVEIEKKNLLTKEEYNLIYNQYGLGEEFRFTQINTYFDTREMTLKKNRAALRIRTKENFAEMTLKIPHGDHLLEVNETLALEEAGTMIQEKTFIPKDSIVEEMKKLGITEDFEVFLLTSLKTTRIEKKMAKGLLVLDQSWYNGKSDFELEVEAASETGASQLFQSILTQMSIEKRKTPNKIIRAMNSLNS